MRPVCFLYQHYLFSTNLLYLFFFFSAGYPQGSFEIVSFDIGPRWWKSVPLRAVWHQIFRVHLFWIDFFIRFLMDFDSIFDPFFMLIIFNDFSASLFSWALVFQNCRRIFLFCSDQFLNLVLNPFFSMRKLVFGTHYLAGLFRKWSEFCIDFSGRASILGCFLLWIFHDVLGIVFSASIFAFFFSRIFNV